MVDYLLQGLRLQRLHLERSGQRWQCSEQPTQSHLTQLQPAQLQHQCVGIQGHSLAGEHASACTSTWSLPNTALMGPETGAYSHADQLSSMSA